MKNFMNMLVFVFVAAVSFPAFANAPETVEECQETYAGDEAKIEACIDGLEG